MPNGLVQELAVAVEVKIEGQALRDLVNLRIGAYVAPECRDAGQAALELMTDGNLGRAAFRCRPV
jgi:hypothetical protein